MRFRLTPQTTVMAERLLQALVAAGFDARAEIDLNYEDGVGESDEADPVRDDAYRQVVVDAAGEPTLSVCEGGVFVTTDSLDDEDQGENATLVRLVSIAERVTGWRLVDRDALLAEAAHYGVGPDGSLESPSTLSGGDLSAAAAALCERVSGTADRPRPVELLTSPALRAIVEQLNSALPLADRPATFTWEPHETGYGVQYSPQTDVTRSAIEGVASRLPRGLYAELGSEGSGRPTRVAITLPAYEPPRVDIYFDTLPPSQIPGVPPIGWEYGVIEMSRREPQWVPNWIPEALSLLRRAGRRV